MTPAEIIIKKFQGQVELARTLRIRESTVYRWTYPRERGGTGGLVPAKYQSAVLQAGKDLPDPVTPEDFFPAQDTAA